MTFDPFADFQERGYLRNVHGLKDMALVKGLENLTFQATLEETLGWLSRQDNLNYACLLETHKRLFEGLYPWAGQDRTQTSPNKTVVKGNLVFANPEEIQRAFNAGLREKTPGRMLGQWAYAHPFLECNGRALFTFLSEYLHRECKLIMWSELNSYAFLRALTKQMEDPKDPELDKVIGEITRNIAPSSSLPEIVEQLSRIDWTQDPTERKTTP